MFVVAGSKWVQQVVGHFGVFGKILGLRGSVPERTMRVLVLVAVVGHVGTVSGMLCFLEVLVVSGMLCYPEVLVVSGMLCFPEVPVVSRRALVRESDTVELC